MIVSYTKSFEKSVQKFPERDRIENVIETFIKDLEQNIRPHGLGLKRLRDDIWEIRVGIRTRILFLLIPGEIRFLLVGDHDEIKDYLKN